MARRKGGELMGLAILALLDERPMHPYEMSVLMKQRRITASVKLNAGSLYSNINALAADGLIAVKAVEQDGKMPERTVYEITPQGTEHCFELLREILRVPVKEFPRFAAGLSFMAHLRPEDTAALLAERVTQLKRLTDKENAFLATARKAGVSELFLLESDFTLRMVEAELAWAASLQKRVAAGELSASVGDGIKWTALIANGASKGPENAE